MEDQPRYEVIVTPQAGGGFAATVPDLPDVVTEADTREEAFAMAKDAIEGYLEAMRDHGWDVPGAAEPVEESEQRLPEIDGLRPARGPKRPAGKPIKTKGIVSDLIPEQRR